jgi:hypothetical protein
MGARSGQMLACGQGGGGGGVRRSGSHCNGTPLPCGSQRQSHSSSPKHRRAGAPSQTRTSPPPPCCTSARFACTLCGKA